MWQRAGGPRRALPLLPSLLRVTLSFGKDDADTEEQLRTETDLHFHLTTERKALACSLLRHADSQRAAGAGEVTKANSNQRLF